MHVVVMNLPFLELIKISAIRDGKESLLFLLWELIKRSVMKDEIGETENSELV